MSLPPLTTVYCLDFPENWLLGIDLFHFQSTSQFSGVKLIPTGIHSFHWGADLESIRYGKFFIQTKDDSNLIILKYDRNTETVCTEEDIGELDVSAIKSRLGEAYPFMIVYEELKRATLSQVQGSIFENSWEILTQYITKSGLDSLVPHNPIISSTSATATETEVLRRSLLDAAKDRAEKDRSVADHEVAKDKIIRTLINESDIELRFIEINIKKRLADPALTGRDLTNSYLDKSWYLGDILSSLNPPGFKSFLGQLQFSFLLLLLFANYSGALQWFSMVQLLLDCEKAFVTNSQHSTSFLRVLKNHLDACPTDYFEQFWDRKEFSSMMLKFHENVYGHECWQLESSGLIDVCAEVFRVCEKKFGIAFPEQVSYQIDLSDEEGPVIVGIEN